MLFLCDCTQSTFNVSHFFSLFFSEQPTSSSGPPAAEKSELIKKQEEMFSSMESQYEVARLATHTHRGVGLGFGTFQYPRWKSLRKIWSLSQVEAVQETCTDSFLIVNFLYCVLSRVKSWNFLAFPITLS